MRRRSSLARLLIPAVLVGSVLWLARVWPFQRGEAPLPARIPAVSDGVRQTYDSLEGDFRARVPLAEFATMAQKMKEFDSAGESPRILEAQANEPAGPEALLARFHVEHPGEQAKADYAFARIEGIWKLQSYARDSQAWSRAAGGPKPSASFPAAAVPKPGTPAEGPPGGEVPVPAAPRLSGASLGPRSYVIQPGDRLETISRQFYGAGRHWRRIVEANPGLDPRRLNIGRRIVIPAPPERPPTDRGPEPDTGPEPPKS